MFTYSPWKEVFMVNIYQTEKLLCIFVFNLIQVKINVFSEDKILGICQTLRNQVAEFFTECGHWFIFLFTECTSAVLCITASIVDPGRNPFVMS